MAIHVDISIKSLDNLRRDARDKGVSVRDLASQYLEWMFCGDRSVFQFTPALAQELMPKCELLFDAALGKPQLLNELHDFAVKLLAERKEQEENERIKELKKEDAGAGEANESNDGSSTGPQLVN